MVEESVSISFVKSRGDIGPSLQIKIKIEMKILKK